jgi:hypothetical protein
MKINNVEPWQQKILTDIESGGFRPGEMAVVAAGRNTGKSALSLHFWKDRLADSWYQGASAECDDGVWHSVICFANVAAWLRAQDPALWTETSHTHGLASTFDIADSLLVLLNLRWGAKRG